MTVECILTLAVGEILQVYLVTITVSIYELLNEPVDCSHLSTDNIDPRP